MRLQSRTVKVKLRWSMIMSASTEQAAEEFRALTADDLEAVSGGFVKEIALSIAASLLYDWLKAPSTKTIPEFFSYLND